MVTIYFDKQVFSHLRNAKEEKYVKLYEKISSHKDEFIFLFSNAHLFDLKQDKTEIKYGEMEFIQSIVDSNRMVYDKHEEDEQPYLMVYKESPLSAFDRVGEMGDSSWIEKIETSQLTEEQRNVINNLIDIFTKEQMGQLESNWLVNRQPVSLETLQINKDTLVSLMRNVENVFYKSTDGYKIIRDNVISTYKHWLENTKCQNDFNTLLEASPLGLSFTNAVKAAIVQCGLPSSDKAMEYYVSYILLDLFGISKEPRKKVNFRNMQTDCIHSFFGSFCDCIVSEDEGVRDKSLKLYNLYGITTKVYSIDEFIDAFDEAIANNRKSLYEFLEQINRDYGLKQIIRIDNAAQYTLTYLQASSEYFGYFTGMAELSTAEDTTLILYKNKWTNQMLLLNEIKILVNRIANAFNEIGIQFPLFNPDAEYPLIQEDKWDRTLRLNNVNFCLTKLKGTPTLCLLIRLKQITHVA